MPRDHTSSKGGAKRAVRDSIHASRYDELTVFDLKRQAKDLGLTGYCDKSKAELIEMVRNG